MIDEKGRTNITIYFNDGQKLVAQFIYDEKNPIERPYCCNLRYYYFAENYLMEISNTRSFQNSYNDSKMMLITDIIAKYVNDGYLDGLHQAFECIDDIFFDEDIIGDAVIHIG